MSALAPATGIGRPIRTLLLVAMAVFVVTVVIGILNGLNLVDFSRDLLLTHVHSGTIGWISLGIIAAAFWLTGQADPRMAWSLAILVPIYVVAFASGNLALRAITGTPLLVVIVILFVWAWRAALATRSFPAIAVALALTTFAYGALFGVLLQIAFATGTTLLPGDGIGAHAATMTTSYLMLAAMGLVEWRLLGTRGVPRAGLVQIGALFLGGVILASALLFEIDLQLAGGLNILLQLISVVIFIIRIWPAALRAVWGEADDQRHVAFAALVIPFSMAMLVAVIAIVATAEDPNALPTGLLLAFDHSVFIGVITNIMFGLVYRLTADRPAESAGLRSLVFLGVNLGMIVFVVGLITESTALKMIGSPVMGLSLLVALAVLVQRLLASNVEAAATA